MKAIGRYQKFLRILWLFVLAVVSGSATAQTSGEVAFAVGSYEGETREVRVVNDGILWTVTDMDDGTSFILINEPYLLSVSKEKGVIFITAADVRQESQALTMIGSLPIKIARGTKVQFTCEKGRFIYLYNRLR